MTTQILGLCSIVYLGILLGGSAPDRHADAALYPAPIDAACKNGGGDDDSDENPCNNCMTTMHVMIDAIPPFVINPADWIPGAVFLGGVANNADGTCVPAEQTCSQTSKCKGKAQPAIGVVNPGWGACITPFPFGPCVTTPAGGPPATLIHPTAIQWQLDCNTNSGTELKIYLYDNLGNNVGVARYRGSCQSCKTGVEAPPF